MKQIHLLLFIIISFFTVSSFAQSQIPNGGFEVWSGIDPVRPDGWSTTEQIVGLKPGKWVTQESAPGFVRTGVYSVRLEGDTTSAVDGYKFLPGIMVAGKALLVKNKIVSSGIPVNGRPATLSFYVRLNHEIRDTASVRLLLTRRNPSLGKQDTVAYERKDVFPDSISMGGFALFTDSIYYRLLGDADTARILIYGGRMRNSAARGNKTWIDGVSFGYSIPAAPRSSALADSMWLSPNPVINSLNVKSDSSMQGYKIIIQAETSVIVKEITLSTLNMTVDMTDLPVGNYSYALIDRDQRKIRDGYISVLRN